VKRREFVIAGGALAASMALPARAAYPDKPVRYYIAFAPGGESDIAARLQQNVWKRKFGHEMVIESKAGAGGALAWSQLNQFPGDGYTIMGTNLPHIVLQPLEGNVQYKTEDITNVHFFNYTPDGIVVRNESPFKTYQDLIAAAQGEARRAQLRRLGQQLRQPRRACAPQCRRRHQDHVRGLQGHRRPALVRCSAARGRRDVVFVLALAQKGKTRLLAVATPQRLSYFPDVPTFRELGSTGWMAPIAAWACRSRRRRTCGSASPTASRR
jgi:tripartite-type tricarboxylate transporter receptor subunit TctC